MLDQIVGKLFQDAHGVLNPLNVPPHPIGLSQADLPGIIVILIHKIIQIISQTPSSINPTAIPLQDNNKIEMIQHFQKYNSFVREKVFQHLVELYNKKIAGMAGYVRTLAELAAELEGRRKAICSYLDDDGKPHRELEIYARVFGKVKEELHEEMREVEANMQRQEQSYLYSLDACKLSFIANQKQVIDFAQKELEGHEARIHQKLSEIRDKQKEIQSIKQDSFCRMLQIATQLDNQLLREKYMQKQSQKGFKFFGSRRKEMYDKLDVITQVQEEAREKVKEIRGIEKEKVEFVEKICESLNSIERGKIGLLLEICEKFRSPLKVPDVEVNYKQAIEFKRKDDPTFNNREFIQNYKKSIYLLFNPHPQNHILLEHRTSIANKISSSSVRENRMGHQYSPTSLDFQIGQPKQKPLKSDYDGYLQLLQIIRTTVASSYLSQAQLQGFYTYFKSCLGKKPLRQVFLFYLYQLGREKFQMVALIHKETTILVKMIDIFLTECIHFYDTQSTIKILMLTYHIELQGLQLYQAVRDHEIWRNQDFWETSFLESVYEHLEMGIVHFHKGEQGSKVEENRQLKWLTSIFKIWPRQEKKSTTEEESPLDLYFREVVKNSSLLYLANMAMMSVPYNIVDRFKRRIVQAILRMKWSSQSRQQLSSWMQAVGRKGEQTVKKLLRDQSLLQKLMSKLIGGGEQQSTGVPLSQLIAGWLQAK